MTDTARNVILRRLATREGRDLIRSVGIDILNMLIENRDTDKLVAFFEHLPECDTVELLR